jgi:hypothetical protein
VTGLDEESPDVNNEVYTMVAARTTLQDAVAAAQVLGTPAQLRAVHPRRVRPVLRDPERGAFTFMTDFSRVRAWWLRIRITKGSQKPLKKTKTDKNPPPPTTPMLEELVANR